MHRHRLHKRSMHRGHGFAAIHPLVMVRRAVHRIAAPHCLFWRRGSLAVECIRPESNREYRQKDGLCKTHYPLG